MPEETTNFTPPWLDASDITVNEADGTAVFTVIRTGDVSRSGSINYSTRGISATPDSDFTPTTGALTFETGENSKTVAIPIINDNDVEGAEIVALAFDYSSIQNMYLRRVEAAATITSDDAAAPRLMIDGGGNVGESAGQARITFRREGDLSRTSAISYRTEGNSATVGEDFEAASGVVNFAAGEASQTVTVNILNDSRSESDESFRVVLDRASATQFDSSLPEGVTVTVQDDDQPAPTLRMSLNGGPVVREDAGTLSFTLSRDGSLIRASSVGYRIVGDTATAGEDFEAQDGVVTFAAGESSKTITVALRNDDLVEGTEALRLEIDRSRMTNLTAYGERVSAWIQSDDQPPPTLRMSLNGGPVIREDAGSLSFTLSREGALTRESSVPYRITSDNATTGEDYEAQEGLVTFAAGESSKTITVGLRNDDRHETTESLRLEIDRSRMTNLTAYGERVSAWIQDDDDLAPTLRLSTNTSLVRENAGSISFTLTRQGAVSRESSVGFRIVGDTATAGEDFEAKDGTVTFAAGESSKTIMVGLRDDDRHENTESLRLEIDRSRMTNLTAAGDQVTVWVQDNDEALPLPELRIENTTANEGDGVALFTVSRTGDLSRVSRVSYTTRPDTAAIATGLYGSGDFQLASDQLIFAAGEASKTIRVSLVDDREVEPSENFRVHLFSPADAVIRNTVGVATIFDNDVAPISNGRLITGQRRRADTLAGGSGNDTFNGRGGNDDLDGGAGDDRALFFAPSGNFRITTLCGVTEVKGLRGAGDYQNTITTLIDIENLYFSNGVIKVNDGTDESDRILGSAGADLMDGGYGDDTLSGGNGADILAGGAGDDMLYGGSGTDRVLFSASQSQYQFTRTDGGMIRVSGPEGTDLLNSIETVAFGDDAPMAIGRLLTSSTITTRSVSAAAATSLTAAAMASILTHSVASTVTSLALSLTSHTRTTNTEMRNLGQLGIV